MPAISAKVYPNGEFSVYRPKKFKPDPIREEASIKRNEALDDLIAMNQAMGGPGLSAVIDNVEALREDPSLGLSIHRNFDKPTEKKRYGLKGITSRGRKFVRNGAYLLQKKVGKERLSFLTLTVPPMCLTKMHKLHTEWHKVMDATKRRLTRLLKSKGLPGSVVMVVEIQEERYENTGIPVLHIHAIFEGRKPYGSWAVTTTEIDQIWKETLEERTEQQIEIKSACNIERVKESAEGYLGKYMSKGFWQVEKVVAAGYGDWLPKQWWSMSRKLTTAIKNRIKTMREESFFLWNACLDGDSPILLFSRAIVLENKQGQKYVASYYGRLKPELVEQMF